VQKVVRGLKFPQSKTMKSKLQSCSDARVELVLHEEACQAGGAMVLWKVKDLL